MKEKKYEILENGKKKKKTIGEMEVELMELEECYNSLIKIQDYLLEEKEKASKAGELDFWNASNYGVCKSLGNGLNRTKRNIRVLKEIIEEAKGKSND